jgi:hypothetical protein
MASLRIPVIASPTLFAFVGRGNPGINPWQSSFLLLFGFEHSSKLFFWIATSQKAAPRNDAKKIAKIVA